MIVCAAMPALHAAVGYRYTGATLRRQRQPVLAARYFASVRMRSASANTKVRLGHCQCTMLPWAQFEGGPGQL